MKLATTTSDFNSYTGSQITSLRYIREAGFRYADYSFGLDHSARTGVYAPDHESYLEQVGKAAEDIGIKLVQAHSPMGTPLTDPDGGFLPTPSAVWTPAVPGEFPIWWCIRVIPRDLPRRRPLKPTSASSSPSWSAPRNTARIFWWKISTKCA